MYLELEQLSKHFDNVVAVDNVSLGVAQGEFITLLGPSGSGKTSLLRMIAGFATPTHGHIRIAGEPIEAKPPHKRNLGMVFQDYSLFPHMTVFQNVAFGLRMRGLSRQEQSARVGQALETVRLTGYETRRPDQLSGGQRQRVALARAIVIEPLVLLLDETLGALDRKLREEMQVELRRIHDLLEVTTIFVTHDQDEALSLSDRIAIMNQGSLHQVGTPFEVYERPATPFVADFLGKANLLWLTVVAARPDHLAARFPGGPVITLPADKKARVGDEIRILVRPERIACHHNGDPGSPNRIQCSVERAIYLGSGMFFNLVGPGDIPLTAFLSARELADRPPPKAGQAVEISWPEDASIIVEYKQA